MSITEVSFSRSFLSLISSMKEFPEEGVLEFETATVGIILSITGLTSGVSTSLSELSVTTGIVGGNTAGVITVPVACEYHRATFPGAFIQSTRLFTSLGSVWSTLVVATGTTGTVTHTTGGATHTTVTAG